MVLGADREAIVERSWVILVTDGTAIEFAPELYASHEHATDEAHRWAWLLSADGAAEIHEPFDGRIRVGIRDIRVVEVVGGSRAVDPWVGTYWTSDGYPDPEAVLLFGRADAEAWATSPIDGLAPTSVETSPWHIAATFLSRGEEAYAVAHLAKEVCVCPPA